jgi:predicted TIM-barrel fold metal-dependent hydrolase
LTPNRRHAALALLLHATTAGVGIAQEGPATRPQERAGTAVYAGGELLTDYRPVPTLVTQRTRVDKPKYPVTDIHCHWSDAQDPRRLLAAMDALGLRRAVNLSGGHGAALDRMLAAARAADPDRLLVFCDVDMSRIDDSAFAADAVASLERAKAAGAAGLKVFKSLGLTVKDKAGAVVPVDDRRLDPVWAACGRLKMPVLIHSGDPAAFFRPADATNERWLQLRRHPDWNFSGPGFPTFEEVMAQHNRVVERHPGTVFISAHLANCGEDLARLSDWLDRYPNLYVDLSGRVAELGRQPYAARRFLVRYQDRVLFGTDRYPGRPDQPRERIYYRFLETDDEYFDYYDHPFPPEGEWKIYGVFLPDEVLRKAYHANADRALQGLPPAISERR